MWLNVKNPDEVKGEVHLQVHGALQGLQVDLGSVVRPRAELHLTALLVEREEGDVDGAGGLVDGWRHPADSAGVKQLGFGHVADGKLPICTGNTVYYSPSLILSQKENQQTRSQAHLQTQRLIIDL